MRASGSRVNGRFSLKSNIASGLLELWTVCFGFT